MSTKKRRGFGEVYAGAAAVNPPPVNPPPVGGAGKPLGSQLSGSKRNAEGKAAGEGGGEGGGGGGGGGGAFEQIKNISSKPEFVHYVHNFVFFSGHQYCLSLADNIHDGWSGYRNKEPSDTTNIRKAILNAYRKRFGPGFFPDTDDYSAVAKAAIEYFLSNKGTDSISICNIEDSLIAWFEDNIDFLSRRNPTAVYTYDTILADPIGLATAAKNENDSFYLKPGMSDIDTLLSTPAKKQIQDFILTFLIGTIDANIYMTFDAAPKIVGKIFRDHDNVSGLIMPQNIGDSATTSFKKLGRNDDLYLFPQNGQENIFICDRNTLLQGNSDNISDLTMYYENENFSSKFPFNFTFGIKTKVIQKQLNKSYKDGANQGPALDYLLGLMMEAQGATAENPAKFSRVIPATSCLRIGDAINPVGEDSTIKDIIINEKGVIFLDMKRGGDHHAVLAALKVLLDFIDQNKYVIFVTIDRLCALLARLLGIPCILHYNDTITLYKNTYNERGVSEEARKAFFAKKEENFITQYGALYGAYNGANAEINIKTLLCSIYDSLSINDVTNQPLLYNRIVDIFNHLKKFYDLLISYKTLPETASLVAKGATATAAVAAAGADVAAVAVANTELNTARYNIIKHFLSYFEKENIDTVMLFGIKEIAEVPVPVPAVAPAPALPGILTFNYNGEYPLFKYSYKQFEELRVANTEYIRIRDSTRPRRIPINYESLLNESDGFNTLLSAYSQTFYDTDQGAKAYTAYSYRGEPAVINAAKVKIKEYYDKEEKYKQTRSIGERNETNEALKAALASAEVLRTLLIQDVGGFAPNIPNIGDPSICQAGGAYSLKKIEAFKNICDKAGRFMNSQIGRIFPELTIIYALKQYLYYKTLPDSEQQEQLVISSKNLIEVSKITYTKVMRKYIATLDEGDEDIAIITGNIAKIEGINIDGDINTWIAENAGLFTINVDNIIHNVTTSAAVNLLTELYGSWLSVAAEDAAADGTDTIISVLLDPYSDIALDTTNDDTMILDEKNLKLGHPLMTGITNPPTPGTIYAEYTQKVDDDTILNYINIDRPVIYSLLVLTMFDDIIKGNTGIYTSLVIASSAGQLPAAAGYILINEDTWGSLPDLIRDSFIMVMRGAISRERFQLAQGGARKHRKNRTRKLHVKRRRTIKRRRS
jgi:hypothetical protein